MNYNRINSPKSGFELGFGNDHNSVIWRLCVHDGTVYAGAHDWSSYLTLFKRVPDRLQRSSDWEMSSQVQGEAGFDLWRSSNGDNWERVTYNEFRNPDNYGLCTLLSTPKGLFAGTVALHDWIEGQLMGCKVRRF